MYFFHIYCKSCAKLRIDTHSCIVFQVCDICGDTFEQFWDEDAEEWHLKDAVRVNNKVSVLCTCIKTVADQISIA